MGDNNKISNNEDLSVSEDREETILKVLLNIADNLEVLSKQIRETVTPIVEKRIKEAEEKENAFSFEFHEPLKKDGGFERFLMKVLNAEKEKHEGFVYTIERNQNNEIVGVRVKAEKEHLKDVSSVVNWINKRILEGKNRKEGVKGENGAKETKNNS